MKWSEMSSDQRDQLIHEKVMGNPDIPCTGRFIPADYTGRNSLLCISCGAKDQRIGSAKHNPLPPPRYSEEMNDAMHVIKKMRNDHGCLWRISIEPYISPPNIVILTVRDREVGCHGAFLAETICLVALKFLGVETEGE